MTIAQRLYLLIGVMATALAVLGGVSVYQMRSVFVAASYANDNTVPSMQTLDDAFSRFASLRLASWQVLTASDAQARGDVQRTIQDARAGLAKAFDTYEKDLLSNEEDRSLLSDNRRKMVAFNQLLDELVNLAGAGQDEAARQKQQASLVAAAELEAALTRHREFNRKLGEQGAADANASYRSSTWLTVGIVVLTIVGGFAMGLPLTKRIVDSLRNAVSVAQTVAGGDLTRHIEARSNDEVGQLMQSLRDMNDKLVNIVSQVREGTDTMVSASNQIAAGNLELSARTEQQASALEETASSMEQLTTTVQQNSSHARQADRLANSAAQEAEGGGAIVREVVGKMTSISDSSRRINDIIGVIDGIAFQTNILALNAAVEAARAGEQGRGFAVVASEVRSLAQRSASAAKEIKTLIEESVSHVDAGNKLAADAGTAMQTIVDSIQHVSTAVGEIARASDEQAAGIGQVNQAIVEMDGATQQNAAVVEEAAAAAGALQEQAARLSELVGIFKLQLRTPPQQAATAPALRGPRGGRDTRALAA